MIVNILPGALPLLSELATRGVVAVRPAPLVAITRSSIIELVGWWCPQDSRIYSGALLLGLSTEERAAPQTSLRFGLGLSAA